MLNFNDNFYMKKIKDMKKSNLSDPYEDFVRIEKLDAYEAQIQSNQIKSNSRKNKKSLE